MAGGTGAQLTAKQFCGRNTGNLGQEELQRRKKREEWKGRLGNLVEVQVGRKGRWMFLRTGKSQIQVTEVRIAVILTHWPPDL